MNKKWLALAAEMLEELSKRLSMHSCNDWEFPPDWNEQDKWEFFGALVASEGNDDQEPPPMDWQVAGFLGKWLSELDELPYR
jgi:hypothetical protein